MLCLAAQVVNICPGPVTSEITLHSFTEAAGERLGKEQEATIKRMSADRCAELYAAAMWAGVPEAWLSPQVTRSTEVVQV